MDDVQVEAGQNLTAGFPFQQESKGGLDALGLRIPAAGQAAIGPVSERYPMPRTAPRVLHLNGKDHGFAACVLLNFDILLHESVSLPVFCSHYSDIVLQSDKELTLGVFEVADVHGHQLSASPESGGHISRCRRQDSPLY